MVKFKRHVVIAVVIAVAIAVAAHITSFVCHMMSQVGINFLTYHGYCRFYILFIIYLTLIPSGHNDENNESEHEAPKEIFFKIF